MRLNRLSAALGGMLLAAAVMGQAPVGAQEEDDAVVMSATDDPAVNAAKDRAREMLPYFWSALDDPAPDETAFSLKVGFDVPDGGQEHIWVSDIMRSGDLIKGTLDNYPAYVPDLEIGDSVTFTEDRITDWGFRRDDLLVGHYTTRVLLDQMEPEEAAPIRALLGEAP